MRGSWLPSEMFLQQGSTGKDEQREQRLLWLQYQNLGILVLGLINIVDFESSRFVAQLIQFCVNADNGRFEHVKLLQSTVRMGRHVVLNFNAIVTLVSRGNGLRVGALSGRRLLCIVSDNVAISAIFFTELVVLCKVKCKICTVPRYIRY